MAVKEIKVFIKCALMTAYQIVTNTWHDSDPEKPNSGGD